MKKLCEMTCRHVSFTIIIYSMDAHCQMTSYSKEETEKNLEILFLLQRKIYSNCGIVCVLCLLL